jgi:hypothetical protein
MTDRDQYKLGLASGAEVGTDGKRWTLFLVREPGHSPQLDKGETK